MSDYPSPEYLNHRTLPVDFPFPPFTDISSALKPTFRLYRDNIGQILKIVLALYAPLVLAQYFLPFLTDNWAWRIVLGLLNNAGYSLLAGALIYSTVVYLRTGTNPNLSECYRWGFRKWGVTLGCNILVGIYSGIGFVLLIIPGIFLLVLYSLVNPIIVIEDLGALDAMKRSDQLTRGYRWRIFGTLFVFGLITFGVSVFFRGGLFGPQKESFGDAVISALIIEVVQASTIIVALFIYLGILSDSNRVYEPTPYVSPTPEQER